MDQTYGSGTTGGTTTGEETIAAGGTTAGSDAAGRFAKAKEYVGDRYSAASEAVRNRYTAVRGKVDEIDFNEVTEKVRDYVRSNPGKALLMSVGVGFAIGMLLRRGSDED